jgi:hypothetical protein
MWEDLQRTANPEAKIDAMEVDIKQLLMALFFLTVYPKRPLLLEGIFKLCEPKVAQWCFLLLLERSQHSKERR